MMKAGAALLGLLILSGCALPVPVRLASWAIDGISILMTKKSIADHGISVVADRDCAMWRSLTGKELTHTGLELPLMTSVLGPRDRIVTADSAGRVLTVELEDSVARSLV